MSFDMFIITCLLGGFGWWVIQDARKTKCPTCGKRYDRYLRDTCPYCTPIRLRNYGAGCGIVVTSFGVFGLFALFGNPGLGAMALVALLAVPIGEWIFHTPGEEVSPRVLPQILLIIVLMILAVMLVAPGWTPWEQ